MLIDFCLPVQNEEKILEINARRLYNFLKESSSLYDWRIVIVVNGSTDSSQPIAHQLEIFDKNHFLLKYLSVSGKGRAIKSYFTDSSADILVFMDIDLAVSLKNLPALINPLINNQADLVVGSRLLADSSTNRSWGRSLSSRFYNFLSRFLLRNKISDTQCGFKAMQNKTFKDIEKHLQDQQWFFDTELIAWAIKHGQRVREVPINWQENRYQTRKSKIRVWRDPWLFVINLIKLRRQLRNYKR